jgi:hypothetical protein
MVISGSSSLPIGLVDVAATPVDTEVTRFLAEIAREQQVTDTDGQVDVVADLTVRALVAAAASGRHYANARAAATERSHADDVEKEALGVAHVLADQLDMYIDQARFLEDLRRDDLSARAATFDTAAAELSGVLERFAHRFFGGL